MNESKIIVTDARLTDDEIYRVLELDSLVYPTEYQSSFEEVKARVMKCEDCFITARLNNRIIGYICFFPITKSLSDKILTGAFNNDSNIIPSDVISYKCSEGVLYIISIVVHPSMHNTSVIKGIMREYDLKLVELKENYKIHNVIASAISQSGVSTLYKSGFKVINELQNGNLLIMSKII